MDSTRQQVLTATQQIDVTTGDIWDHAKDVREETDFSGMIADLQAQVDILYVILVERAEVYGPEDNAAYRTFPFPHDHYNEHITDAYKFLAEAKAKAEDAQSAAQEASDLAATAQTEADNAYSYAQDAADQAAQMIDNVETVESILAEITPDDLDV